MHGDEHDVDTIDEITTYLIDLAADEGRELTETVAYQQASTHI